MFEVRPFNGAELANSIGGEDYLRSGDDSHLRYLTGYLTSLDCHWMVIEDGYIDRDYLDDYANYYSKCFREYKRFCRRIHFFKELREDEFLKYATTGDGEDILQTLQGNYLGFLVVKPLPETRIGRTLLATYEGTVTDGPEVMGDRTIRCLDHHYAHLGGFSLSVDSLPFQEQDSVTAACATSAIWSALQCTARRFGYYAPTPFEITKAATMYFQESRPFPNTGLNVSQICRAIISTGLEPDINEYLDPAIEERVPKNILMADIYAYLRAGIPVIALVTLDGLGEHAVTLTGYRIDEGAEPWDEMHSVHKRDYGFYLMGSRIAQLYGHDDQLGPFAKMGVVVPDGGGAIRFESDWTDRDGKPIGMWPFMMVTPVYKKIRVPFTAPLPYVFEVQTVIDPSGTLRKKGFVIEWDAYLSEISSYKAEMFNREDLPKEVKGDIMSASFPRFFWRYRAFCGSEELFEVLADATDFERSFQLFRMTHFSPEFRDVLVEVLESVSPDALRTRQLHEFLHYWSTD